jgi:hypothetical protein
MASKKGSKASRQKPRLINIEDVLEPFCGRGGGKVPLRDSEPGLALEWCYARNAGWGPEDLSRGSCVYAWWTCPTCSHTYRAKIADRALRRRGCPVCKKKALRENANFAERTQSGHIILSSQTKKINRIYYELLGRDNIRLSKSHPLAKQWHPIKNGPYNISDFSVRSHTVVWWKCKKDPEHEWQSQISSRTDPRAAMGCPFCSNKRISDTNSLLAKFPDLAQEWHPKRNGKLTAKDVTAGSGKKVWWLCKKDPKHQWQALVVDRSRTNHGCPDCSRRRLSDVNRLSKCYPKIAAQLHPTKNGDLKASQLTVSSKIPVWWKCPVGEDHEWRRTTAQRVETGTGCPACRGIKVSVTNSLATLYPEIAKLWDQKKNGKLRPTDVVCRSKKTVWWLCKKGHSWAGLIGKRVRAKWLCTECRE